MKTETNGNALVVGAFGVVALFIGMILYGAWASAFVIAHMWLWFIVPVFKVAILSKTQAYGLSLVVSYMTYTHYSHYDKDEREWKARFIEILVLILRPWLYLTIAYIVKTFFM